MRWENVIWKWMAVVWLLAVSLSTAAEIVAWKVPLTRFAVHGMDSEGLVRRKVPPEASPFFGAGDELWDLSALSKDQRIDTNTPLDWAVWNSTTSTLVTKSDWNGIWQLHRRMNVLDQPMQSRVNIEVFQAPHDGSEPSDKEMRADSVSLVTRSGFEANAEVRSQVKSLRAKLEPSMDIYADLIDLKMECSIALPSQAGLEFATELTLRAGQPVWVARDFDGTRGLDVRVSASVELPDGAPSSDIIRIQTGNGWRNVIRRRQDFGIHRLAYDEWLGVADAVNETIPELELEDPFQDQANLPRVENLARINLPDSVKTRFANPIQDLRGKIEKAGISLAPGELAGHDPLTGTILFLAKSAENLDLLEERFNRGRRLSPRITITTLEGAGQTRLASRSQGKATLIRSSGGKEVRRIEIVPTLEGKGEGNVGLHYSIHDQPSSNARANPSSDARISVGKWLELSEEKEGGSGKLRARVEVIQLE